MSDLSLNPTTPVTNGAIVSSSNPLPVYVAGGSGTLGATTFTGAITLPTGLSVLLGGSTSSFPALKNVGSTLDIRMANDGGFSDLRAAYFTSAVATAIPAGGSLTVGYLATSTANFGVFFGSGAPSISAAKGSLYLRSDGSSTSTRAYIATDSAGTWTPITTVG